MGKERGRRAQSLIPSLCLANNAVANKTGAALLKRLVYGHGLVFFGLAPQASSDPNIVLYVGERVLGCVSRAKSLLGSRGGGWVVCAIQHFQI